MKITFLGAAGEVTGSNHLLEVGSKKILIDCGMFQGEEGNETKNEADFAFDVASIDAVILTHAHLDHVGRVPKLVKDGYRGPVYATKGTSDLAYLIWEDARHIMEYEEKKFQKTALYHLADVEEAQKLCRGMNYYEKTDIAGLEVVFKDAGHIFGASFVEIKAEGKTIAFSGDIGNIDVPILRETDRLGSVDVLITESTYGNRFHESREEAKEMFVDIVREASQKRGVIMVPAFSLERTQELLYDIHQLIEHGGHFTDMPIYLDSPLAIRAIEVYRKYPEYYDTDATKQYRMGDDFLDFSGLRTTETRDESMSINDSASPKMIIAGSGMMSGGRIVHHAKRYLSDPNSTLVFIGYQAEGTLGRRILKGAERVTIMGDEIPVHCTIRAIGGLSAHGDQDKMVSWVGGAERVPSSIYCVHGESDATSALSARLRTELGSEVVVPKFGDSFEIG
jgi:metallo-beta-lactamase family protein